MQQNQIAATTAGSELQTSTAKHFFVRALDDFRKNPNTGKKDLLDTKNAMVALQSIAANYPQVDSVEAAQLACIYIGQQWDKNLEHCDPATILGAYMQLCSLGIVLRSVQPLAYLVNKGGKCTIFIGADGYQLLARRRYPNLVIKTEFVTQKELANFSLVKGSVNTVTHVLDPIREYEDAVAMYAVIHLDENSPIYDIQIMNTKEREKYIRLHKGGVWNAWGATMWATKLVKKIYKGLGLSDVDGTIATASMNDSQKLDIEQIEYEEIDETLVEETKAILLGCATAKEVKDAYVDFAAKARSLHLEPKDYMTLFTQRNSQIEGGI